MSKFRKDRRAAAALPRAAVAPASNPILPQMSQVSPGEQPEKLAPVATPRLAVIVRRYDGDGCLVCPRGQS